MHFARSVFFLVGLGLGVKQLFSLDAVCMYNLTSFRLKSTSGQAERSYAELLDIRFPCEFPILVRG